VHNDQRRPVGRVEKGAEGPVQHLQVIGVADTRDVPAVANEAGGHVVAERQFGVPLDGDAVVVIDPAEVGELQVAGEGGGFGRDAFHDTAIATQGVHIEVD